MTSIFLPLCLAVYSSDGLGSLPDSSQLALDAPFGVTSSMERDKESEMSLVLFVVHKEESS
jgi:hypothetical protein